MKKIREMLDIENEKEDKWIQGTYTCAIYPVAEWGKDDYLNEDKEQIVGYLPVLSFCSDKKIIDGSLEYPLSSKEECKEAFDCYFREIEEQKQFANDILKGKY
jgi:hypothetical protein